MDDALQVAVRPVFIPKEHIMAGVSGVYNGVLVEAVPIGQTLYYGQGAGQPSTGSGLLADVILAAISHEKINPYPLRIPREAANLVPNEFIKGSHYFRVGFEGDRGVAEKVREAVPGEILSEASGHIAIITDYISEEEADNMLGKLREAGIASHQICHVRFAFFENL